jgi:hypothetical protein
MRPLVSTTAAFAALAVLALPLAPRAQAQSTAAPTAGNGTYIAIDPLAKVRYDNRYDLTLAMAYGHIHAGPNALQGANLGGLDLSSSYWLSKRWAVEGSGRAYIGTSGVACVGLCGNGSNSGQNTVRGPFVSQYLFVAGPEFLGPHNKHADLMFHILGGGAYFLSHDWPQTPSSVGFYDNQIAPAAVFGGHIDLNRSEHWAFRVTPDALFTRYGYSFSTGSQATSPHSSWNFGISVGVQYKFKGKR